MRWHLGWMGCYGGKGTADVAATEKAASIAASSSEACDMAKRIPLTSGDEYDALTRWRRVLRWQAGQRAAIKRRYRRRERRLARLHACTLACYTSCAVSFGVCDLLALASIPLRRSVNTALWPKEVSPVQLRQGPPARGRRANGCMPRRLRPQTPASGVTPL